MTDVLSPERQRDARRLATWRRLLFVGQLALGALYLLVVIVTGIAVSIRDALEGAISSPPVVVAAYFLVLWVAYTVLSYPFDVVGGWILPRRYGLSVQTLDGWLADWAKGLAIGLVLALVVVEVAYALLRLIPNVWWLVAAILYLVLVAGLAQLGPVLFLPMFFKLTPLDEPDLAERLHGLARRAGTRIQGIYRLNLSAKTTAANAMLVGLGRTRRVILGDTLLDRYTSEEIEVVFAHELGHQVHHDIPRLIAFQSAVTLVALYLANLALTQGAARLGYRGIADVATMPLLALVLGVVGTISTPLINWLSRDLESRADCYALTVTEAPRAFSSAMIRLANQNLAVYRPPEWEEWLFYDHPSIGNRVELAKRFEETGRCGR